MSTENTTTPNNPNGGNASLERRIVSYLPPLYYRLFVGYVRYQEMSESATCADIVRRFFDGMPEKERQRILTYSKSNFSKNSY